MKALHHVVFLCLLIVSAVAQAAAPYSKGLLWKVERAGQPASYVFGTMHSEDPRVLALPKPVQQAFDKSKTFVMEAVLDSETGAAIAQAMLLQNGQTLQQLVSPTTYQKTVAALADFGLPEVGVQAMQPWALAVTLGSPKPKTGLFLDVQLMQQATAQGKALHGLETVNEQLEIFSSLSQKEQIGMLEDALNNQALINSMLDDMHRLYLARDLSKLEQLMLTQQSFGNADLEKKLIQKLLYERNQRMVQRMQPFLQSGNVFIAIGALHLAGKNGVLSLLAKQGYRVSPVY